MLRHCQFYRLRAEATVTSCSLPLSSPSHPRQLAPFSLRLVSLASRERGLFEGRSRPWNVPRGLSWAAADNPVGGQVIGRRGVQRVLDGRKKLGAPQAGQAATTRPCSPRDAREGVGNRGWAASCPRIARPAPAPPRGRAGAGRPLCLGRPPNQQAPPTPSRPLPPLTESRPSR